MCIPLDYSCEGTEQLVWLILSCLKEWEEKREKQRKREKERNREGERERQGKRGENKERRQREEYCWRVWVYMYTYSR